MRGSCNNKSGLESRNSEREFNCAFGFADKAQRTRRDSFSFRTVFDVWESAQNKLETSYNRHVGANLTSAFADEFETRTSRVVCAVPKTFFQRFYVFYLRMGIGSSTLHNKISAEK